MLLVWCAFSSRLHTTPITRNRMPNARPKSNNAKPSLKRSANKTAWSKWSCNSVRKSTRWRSSRNDKNNSWLSWRRNTATHWARSTKYYARLSCKLYWWCCCCCCCFCFCRHCYTRVLNCFYNNTKSLYVKNYTCSYFDFSYFYYLFFPASSLNWFWNNFNRNEKQNKQSTKKNQRWCNNNKWRWLSWSNDITPPCCTRTICCVSIVDNRFCNVNIGLFTMNQREACSPRNKKRSWNKSKHTTTN